MTMDITKPSADQQQHTKTKRPFDVAFLMLPDEKLKNKQSRVVTTPHEDDEDEEIEVGDSQDYVPVLRVKNLDDGKHKEQKSAFTKVNLAAAKDLHLSLGSELGYQTSLSPSPPMIPRNYPGMISPNALFKNQQNHAYPSNFIPSDSFATLDANPFVLKNAGDLLPPNFAKMRPMYRPDLSSGVTASYNYQQFPNQTADVRGPAAALLTSLLPPSLAALSLPAQNVCAKCNMSFRMTSDLVYHMRSHHKNDSMDVHKRRREEKLKCPVCAESFRERHHLTRHMTAHQDKDEDETNFSQKNV